MVKYISHDGKRMQELKEIKPMTPDSYRKLLKARGWTHEMLAKRWGLSKRRIQQMIADADRGRYYDDAVMALPTIIIK